MPADNTCYLYPNSFHKKGDKNPCLKLLKDETIKIVCPGCGGIHEYQLAIWAPKEGKKGYFLKLSEPRQKQQSQENQNNQPAEQNQPQQQQQKPPENRRSLLR